MPGALTRRIHAPRDGAGSRCRWTGAAVRLADLGLPFLSLSASAGMPCYGPSVGRVPDPALFRQL